ncbi:Glyoxalase/Bleomycin resistance protein/Dioxygenase superfamily protein [Raineyella antarctica]|uniref:Glyoxalase/Bleomycin resistance protein/Dioxygenase superfamily protein n=1 Tax=Raineyella antarctica TaxID=1577474 RepID=A0A1G6GHB9_9ACTN|nr:VOC family protein [Raineyella antarctica]SDB80576.1 Glyoxalase/Bleomycin resistance protein/Dioxygenase superfamily protein [Raineyella antarctica]
MNITRLTGIGVVVRDLDRATEQYARLLGIDEWSVADLGADRLSESVSYGRRSAGTYRAAYGATPYDPAGPGPMGGAPRPVPFELVQPTGGETPFNEFLLSRGEGIGWLTVLAEGIDEAGIGEHFAGLGIRPAHSHVVDGTVRRTFWDTRDLLGGYLLEVVTSAQVPAGEPVTYDGAALRGGRRALPMQGINHFGVVVDDTMATIANYHDVLGIEKFAIKTWQTEEGRLDSPYYRDIKPVQHGYFTAQGFAGDFGFEVIQCTYGPSHYNREFTDQRGPGIHHIFPYLTMDAADWTASVEAMTQLGAPLCMGSDLRGGAAEYGYFDTFDHLGGFLVEGVHRRFPAEPRYLAPDWEVDFATQVEEV